MSAFVFSLMSITILMTVRYWLVRYQSKRAIKLASTKTIELIYKCDKWITTIHNMSGIDEVTKNRMYHQITRIVKKAGNDDEFYWKAYKEDFDYNALWISPTKWTLGQMYPNLVKLTKANDTELI